MGGRNQDRLPIYLDQRKILARGETDLFHEGESALHPSGRLDTLEKPACETAKAYILSN